MFQSRTHTCNDLRMEHAGQNVTIVGWYENLRKVSKNLGFLVLRDFYGTTQVVIETEEMMEKLIVDRIVGDVVVLEKEDRRHVEVALSEIGFEVKEGSVLLFDGEVYTADKVSEDERRKKLFVMQEKLKRK